MAGSAIDFCIDDEADRRHGQDQDFEKEPLIGADRQRFLEEGIKPPGQRQPDRNPRHAADSQASSANRGDCQRNGGFLARIKAFLEQHRAQENRKQRIDVIAQRGLDRPAGSRSTRHRCSS
jgi:hypothetical protein